MRAVTALLAILLSAGPCAADGINNSGSCTISGSTITCPSGSLTPGSGSVTTVSVTTANGVSGVVANPTTTPAITLTLGAITPSTVTIGAGSAITSSGAGGTVFTTSGGNITGKVQLGNGSFDSDDALLITSRTVTTPLASGGAHALRDETTYTPSASGGYASYDAIASYTGSVASNHFHAFQSRPAISVTATLSDVSGMTHQPTVTGSGPVTGSYGFHMFDALGSGAITNQYGMYCEALTRGSSNYCVYNAGAANNYMGTGTTQIGTGGTLTFGTGFSTFGALLSHDGSGNVIDNPNITIVNGTLTLSNTSTAKVLASGTSINLELSSSSGKLLLTPSTLTAFGGTTASFPALKRSGTTLAVRFADDSADAPITASNGTFSGQLNVTTMTQTAVAQSGTVCYNSGTGAITYDSTVGCLTSTLTEKDDWRDITPQEALAVVLKMQAGSYTYKVGRGLPKGPQIGLAAEQLADIDDRLVGHRPDGSLQGVRYSQASALYPMAIQALQAEIETLKVRQ